jgi:esterase/lipase
MTVTAEIVGVLAIIAGSISALAWFIVKLKTTPIIENSKKIEKRLEKIEEKQEDQDKKIMQSIDDLREDMNKNNMTVLEKINEIALSLERKTNEMVTRPQCAESRKGCVETIKELFSLSNKKKHIKA